MAKSVGLNKTLDKVGVAKFMKDTGIADVYNTGKKYAGELAFLPYGATKVAADSGKTGQRVLSGELLKPPTVKLPEQATAVQKRQLSAEEQALMRRRYGRSLLAGRPTPSKSDTVG